MHCPSQGESPVLPVQRSLCRGRIRRHQGLNNKLAQSFEFIVDYPHTSSVLDHLVNLLLGIHAAKIEALHHWSGFQQLRVVVRWWRKLLEHLPAHASGRLLLSHDRAVSEIALHKEDHLLVSHEDFVAADIVEPSLQGGFCASLILISAQASRSEGWRNRRYKRFRVRRLKVSAELLELGVCTSDIAELSRPEFGKVRLSRCKYARAHLGVCCVAYVYVKPQDSVFLACALQSCDLGLQLVLRLPLLGGMRCSAMVSRRTLWSAVLALGLSLSALLVVLLLLLLLWLLLLLRMRLALWLPLSLLLLIPSTA